MRTSHRHSNSSQFMIRMNKMGKTKATPQRTSSQGSSRKQNDKTLSNERVAALDAAILDFTEELKENTNGTKPIK